MQRCAATMAPGVAVNCYRGALHDMTGQTPLSSKVCRASSDNPRLAPTFPDRRKLNAALRQMPRRARKNGPTLAVFQKCFSCGGGLRRKWRGQGAARNTRHRNAPHNPQPREGATARRALSRRRLLRVGQHNTLAWHVEYPRHVGQARSRPVGRRPNLGNMTMHQVRCTSVAEGVRVPSSSADHRAGPFLLAAALAAVSPRREQQWTMATSFVQPKPN